MKELTMKKKIISLISCAIFFAGVSVYHSMVYAQDEKSQKSIIKKGKRSTTSSRHRKGKPAPVEEIKEEPIENFEAYISEFDISARRKMTEDLLAQGIAFCADKSLEVVCHTFTHTKDFINGALYLFLLDTKGVIYAHGDQPHLVWKNLWDKKDMFGSSIVQSMIELAHNGGGWLTYEWDDAVKVAKVQEIQIGGVPYVIGCGYFPHSKEAAVIGLVKGAVALFNRTVSQGGNVEAVFSDMSYPLSPEFVYGDLYLYALDFKGRIFAQGDRPNIIGSDALEYPDANGKQYNKEIIEKLKEKPEGEGIWVDYISKHAPKHAYAEKVKDDKGNWYFIACGYYPDVTRDTTIDLVRRGYQFMKASGLSMAIKEFNDDQVEAYRHGDLGLFIFDMKGNCLADGRNSDLVGQNQWNNKDEDGRYYIREVIDQAKRGSGWITFKQNNSFLSSYVEKIDLGVGEFIIGSSLFPISKPDTMQLLVKNAVTYLEGHTMDQFLGRLVDRKDQFLRGDLYMYVFDLDGFCYGWADNSRLIWQNLINWKDDNGKPFVKMMIDASNQGPDHIVLKMNKCPRVNYFEQIEKNGKKYVVGSGFYK